MIGNVGFTELMIIMLVVLLVFGAKRLPEVGASIGKGIREFKRSISETNEELNSPADPPSRQLDREPPATDGEPKRLSQ